MFSEQRVSPDRSRSLADWVGRRVFCRRISMRRRLNGRRPAINRRLAAVYDWYLPRVYRYVLSRLGNVAEAEDLTEDIFLRMLGAIADYRQTSVPFSAWLFRIARNHLISFYRKNGLRKDHVFSMIRYRTASTTRRRLSRRNHCSARLRRRSRSCPTRRGTS